MREALRHTVGFVASGAIAFATDAAVLALLTRALKLDPYTARIFAIAVAMVAGYFAHRRLTFRVSEPPSWRQFSKFLGVATGASLVNYAVYALALVLRPGLEPLAALLMATVVAMGVSYAGYRFGVFRRPEL